MIAAIALLGDAPLPQLAPRKRRRQPTKFTPEVRQYILDNRNRTVKAIHADLARLGHDVCMEGIYQVRRRETQPIPRLRRLPTACRHLTPAGQEQVADQLEAMLRQIAGMP